MKNLRHNSNTLYYPFIHTSSHDQHESMERLKAYCTSKKILVVSPHLDDAILSMGSLIASLVEQNSSLTIISLFTQGSSITTPLTTKLLKQSNCPNAQVYFTTRKNEDQHTFNLLGKTIQVVHYDFLDAAWRYDGEQNPLYPDTTINRYHEQDRKLLDEVKKVLLPFRDTHNPQAIFAPLARGKHIDHLLTREASRAVFPEVIYYSDFPYSNAYPNEESFITEHHLQKITWKENYYLQKAEAIFRYKSQAESLFGKEKTLTLPEETFYFSPSIL